MGWDYNSHIVCVCIIMRWPRNRSASWAERFRTSSLLCTYTLCDYYSPIPILSLLLFIPFLYAPILNLQDFTCIYSTGVCLRIMSLRYLKLPLILLVLGFRPPPGLPEFKPESGDPHRPESWKRNLLFCDESNFRPPAMCCKVILLPGY